MTLKFLSISQNYVRIWLIAVSNVWVFLTKPHLVFILLAPAEDSWALCSITILIFAFPKWPSQFARVRVPFVRSPSVAFLQPRLLFVPVGSPPQKGPSHCSRNNRFVHHWLCIWTFLFEVQLCTTIHTRHVPCVQFHTCNESTTEEWWMAAGHTWIHLMLLCSSGAEWWMH